jgi:ATP-binding cassette, subfamily B, bacterial PglK
VKNILSKLVLLMDTSQRKVFFSLVPFIVISSLFQVAGVALMLPFIVLVGKPDQIQSNRYLSSLYEFFRFRTTNEFFIFLGSLLIFIVILSGILAISSFKKSQSFSWDLNHSVSQNLLKRYLGQPYTRYLDQNSSEMSKKILAEVLEVSQGILLPILTIFDRITFIVVSFILLLFVNPIFSLASAAIFSSIYAFIFVFFRKKMSFLADERLIMNTARYKENYQALNAFREIRMKKAESFFINRYSNPSYRFSQSMVEKELLSNLPRYVLEAFVSCGVLISIVLLIQSPASTTEILGVVSIYVVIGFRVLSMIQQVFNLATSIRINRTTLDSVLLEFEQIQVNQTANSGDLVTFDHSIRFESVSFAYPKHEVPAVCSVSIQIPKGSMVAFVGTTGSGKTTMLNLCLGLLSPTLGAIFIDNKELNEKNYDSWHRNIGFVPQNIFLLDDTVENNIAFGSETSNFSDIVWASKIAKADSFICQLPMNYLEEVGERGAQLSGGQIQRIGIARALYTKPDVLVLDEATSALDNATERDVFFELRNSFGSTKPTVIMVAHRLSTVENCDIIFLMENGKIVAQGTFDYLIKNSSEFYLLAESQSK